MPKRIRVLIADDHNVVREGLKLLISADSEIEIAGEAEDGLQAVEMTKRLRPDVVLMDLAMPRSNGLKATQEICRRVPATKVLVLSAYQDEDSVRHLMEVGAAGYMTKHSAATDLLGAIRQVRTGTLYYSPGVAAKLRKQMQNSFAHGLSARSAKLSPREKEVLVLVARGFQNKSIAEELGLSIKTVEKHRQQVMDKLNIHDVAGLTRYAMFKGLLPLPVAAEAAAKVRGSPLRQ